MNIEIGHIIKQELEKSGTTISQFAQKIFRDRTIIYNIFKRKSLDTALLYDISMALNVDLFKTYSDALTRENELIRLQKAKESPLPAPKRKIMLEIEIDEEEYRTLLASHPLPSPRP